jgi:hypothetical protein
LLRAARPHGQDAGDPALAEALALAGREPVLGAWLARERAFDLVMAEKLAAVAPPADLRAAILAGARATPAGRAWWRHPAWLGLAASVTLLLALGGGILLRGRAPASFAAFAAEDTLHGKHGGSGEAMGAMQVLLGQPTTRLGNGLPVDFAALQATGCRTLSFGGHPVMEICFQRAGAQYHLYIARAGDLPAGAGPEYAEEGGADVAAWHDEKFAYAVSGTGGLAAVKELL